MEWLKKLVSSSDDDQASFTSYFGRAVMLDLSPLANKNPSLMKDIARYILKGEPEEVLLKLRSGNTYGEILKLYCCQRSYSREKPRAIFNNIDPDKVACYVRLLHVYEAAVAASQHKSWVIPVPGVSRWLDIFIQEATGLRQYIWNTPDFNSSITADFVEKMLTIAGEPTDMLTRAAFFLNPTDYSTKSSVKTLTSLKGFHSRLAHHAPVVLEALNHSEHRTRVQALEILYNDKVDLTPFQEKIASLACCSAKTVREEAQKIILGKPQPFRELIMRILDEGDNQERIQAVRLYAQIDPEKAPDVLKAKLEMEKAPKVKATIEAVLTEPTSTSKVDAEVSGQSSEELVFEAIPDFNTYQPLPKEIEQELYALIRKYNEQAKNFNKAHENEKWYRNYKMELASDGPVPEAFDQLQNLVVKKKTKQLWNVHFNRFNQFQKSLETIVAKPQFNLVHLFRLLVIFGELHWEEKGEFRFDRIGEMLIRYYFQSHSIPFDTRLVGVAARTVGLDDKAIGWNYLESFYLRNQVIRRPQDYWMYFAENLNIIEEALGFRPKTHQSLYSYWDKEVRKAAFHILTVFPQSPTGFLPKLWELVFDGPKSDRPLARQCLSKVPGREKRIIEALKDGRQEVRAEASSWLADLQWTEAIPDLKQALKKEKSDVAKGAMMEALERMGVSVDDFLDRASLKQKAEKALAKGIPPQLQWFPFEVLPVVRWDNGKKVDPAIIKWMIVLGFKLGSPEPVPVIRKYCQFMHQNERRELGRYILQAWLTQDTIPRYTIETATPEARNRAKQYKQWFPDKSEEQLFEETLHSLLTECLGSAIKEKGILAVTAACSGPEVVPIVEAYLKKWYGHRVHQCRALVQMLSWNEHPLAVQLLLSVANRFRTKGIQEQATQCVNELAERQGWTLDELADRTIPNAGFDAASQLELNFGPRKFICRLNDELEIEIFNEENKPVKNLPNAGKGDDPELAKAAKKELSESKKILKQVLRLQRVRLYENMCTQRTWRFADLRQFLFDHPLMARYCRRLVWAQIINGKTDLTFRLMEDRSLTDAEDNVVKLPDDAVVQLAHSCNVSADVAKAWLQHFEDYKVEPLFDQFTNPMYELSEADRKSDAISQYLGYMIDNFKLRGLIVKYGYTRGQAEDGGFFYLYKKRFSGLKIEAVIEFSGVPLPEENVKVALKNLYFTQIVEGESSYYTPENILSLDDIPPVLLSETWNELRRIAEASEGFDSQWEKKVAY